MKRSGQCPKCHGEKIVRLRRTLDAGHWSGTNPAAPDKRRPGAMVERHIAVRVEEHRGLFGTAESVTTLAPTEAFVCTACGFIEEHVVDAATIDWSDVWGASPWIGER